jgi:hypothetical protein
VVFSYRLTPGPIGKAGARLCAAADNQLPMTSHRGHTSTIIIKTGSYQVYILKGKTGLAKTKEEMYTRLKD